MPRNFIRGHGPWADRRARRRSSKPTRRKSRVGAAGQTRLLFPYRETPATKRLLDLLLSGLALLLLAPLFAAISLAIWFHDGRPVFYRSTRVGKDGVPFEFLKFRTMVPEADLMKADLADQNIHGDGITFKIKEDPRITPIGKLLRRFSLDELPQLLNVFRGEMSLVGPRPPLPSEVARYLPGDMERLSVLPGITCIWQVSGRCHIPFETQVRMDRHYIHNQSLWLDLWLLLKTIPAVVGGRGAY